MRFKASVVLLLLLMQAGTASADSGKAKVTGVYSDLTYHKESGDILGDEVFLVSSNKGYFVVFQGSQGEPYPPVVVPAKVDGSSVKFVLPLQVDPRGEFQGTVVDGELVGTFKANGQTLRLKRKPSYWQ